jgi:hypothetical protein
MSSAHHPQISHLCSTGAKVNGIMSLEGEERGVHSLYFLGSVLEILIFE